MTQTHVPIKWPGLLSRNSRGGEVENLYEEIRNMVMKHLSMHTSDGGLKKDAVVALMKYNKEHKIPIIAKIQNVGIESRVSYISIEEEGISVINISAKKNSQFYKYMTSYFDDIVFEGIVSLPEVIRCHPELENYDPKITLNKISQFQRIPRHHDIWEA